MTTGSSGRDPGPPSPDREGGPGESGGAGAGLGGFPEPCGVPAGAGSGRDASLLVAFVCKVTSSLLLGSLWGGSSHLLLCLSLQLHPKKGNFLVPEARALGLPV